MHPKNRTRTPLLAVAALAGALAFAAPSHAASETTHGFAFTLKQAQRRQLLSEYARARREKRERAEARRAKSHGKRGERMKPAGGEGVNEPMPAGLAGLRPPAFPTRLTAGFPPANVRVNSPDSETTGIGQAEVSVAALGQHMLAAYNDGWGYVTGGSTQGVSYSNDGGLTWTDFGRPPILTNWVWTSDPVVMVDEKKNAFYYCGLVDIGSTSNGIAVAKLTFSGSTPTWGTPVLVVSATNSTIFDKEWMAADSTTGNLYVTYTKFTNTFGSEIFFSKSTNDGANWSLTPIKVSSSAENGLVQGSRVVVGPAGELYVAWYSIGLVDADLYRIRKSTNQGTTFNATIDAVSAFHAFANGAPGFNRGNAVDFPSVAVDRSTGVHRGRVYIAWHESVNFYGDSSYFEKDSLGAAVGPKTEVEPNDAPANANTFTLGQTLRGTLTGVGEQDWFKFTGKRGQTIIAVMDSMDASIDDLMRLICSDGSTRMSLSAPGVGLGYGGQIVFTLPADGVYYLRPFANAGAGGYRIITAVHRNSAARSRDHRDAFVTFSDNGTSWSTPALVNDDPGYYDNWLPEVAVAGGSAAGLAGQVYVAWFDFRDSPAANCGGVSNTYLARSGDGGGSWIALGTISDAQSAWTTVNTNIAPNQGDYLGLFANNTAVWPAWGDGRDGNPNIYSVRLDLGITPTEVALVTADASSDRVSLTWYEGGDPSAATVYRRVVDGAWGSLGTVQPDGSGYLRYVDTAVAPGVTYEYRLGLSQGGSETFAGDVTVSVPLGVRFALLGAQPNPSTRPLRIAFTLPDAAPAHLSVVDVAGRVVRSRDVGGLGGGAHVVDLSAGAPLPAGVYLVHLTRGAEALTARAVIVR